MGLELGRALLLADAVTPQAMSRALLIAVQDDVSLVRALLATDAVDPMRLEEELERVAPDAPVQRHPVPILDLVDRLPAGMCEALVAIPVRRDPRTGTVDVAVADALDPHAADEIGFHLDAPVRLVRAPLSALEEGLARILASRSGTYVAPQPRTLRAGAMVGLDASPPGPDPLVSERPLPLVSHESEPAGAPDIPIPLSRRVAIPLVSAEDVAASDADEDEDDEPIVELRRPKSSQRLPAVALPAAAEPAVEAEPPSDPTFRVHQALGDMTRATARDPLMALVVTAVQSAAPRAALFAVKKDAYVGWMCTPDFGGREELSDVRVDARVPSVFATTAAAGAYVGPLLRNGPHAPLFRFVRSAQPEVVAVSIKAAGKPAVIVFALDVEDSRYAMTVMVEVARVAGEALERIVRAARGEPPSQRPGFGPASRRDRS